MRDPITVTSRIATISAFLVILAAGVLGFTALRDLFISIDLFHPGLGIFFPLLFDLAEVTAAVAVFNAHLQGEDDKFAWRMVLVFTGLGVAANIAHAGHAYYTGRIDGGQLILAVFATSLFPLSVALVTHLLKSVIGRSIRRNELTVSLAELTAKEAEAFETLNRLQNDIDRQTGKRDELKADLAALRKDKRQHGYAGVGDETKAAALEILRNAPGISGAELGRQLGRSDSTGRKLRRDLLPLVTENGRG